MSLDGFCKRCMVALARDRGAARHCRRAGACAGAGRGRARADHQAQGVAESDAAARSGAGVGATQRSRAAPRDGRRRRCATSRVRGCGRSGAAAQHLDFGRVLGHEEAAQLAKQLAQRPDVEWVVPNTRERRLATPNDPFYRDHGAAGRAVVAVSGVGQQQQRARRPPARRARACRLHGTRRPAAPAVSSPCSTPASSTAIPDMAGRVLPGYDFVSDPGYANDSDGRDDDPADPGDWVSQADKNNDPGASLLARSSRARGTAPTSPA